jgi:hypothetical protein
MTTAIGILVSGRVVGVDLTDYWNSRAADKIPNVTFAQSDVLHDRPLEQFDIVYANGSSHFAIQSNSGVLSQPGSALEGVPWYPGARSKRHLVSSWRRRSIKPIACFQLSVSQSAALGLILGRMTQERL